MARIPRYPLHRFVAPGEVFHIARVDTLGAESGAPPHRHTFSEVFWVERGEIEYVINGRWKVLKQGEGVWVKPDDAHALYRRGKRPGVLVNLAYPTRQFAQLARRYGIPSVIEADEPRRRFRLAVDDLPRLGAMADRLDRRRDSRLLLAWFLLELFRLNERSASREHSRLVPAWLEGAMDETRRTGSFHDGPAGLARRVGKSPEHVNRVARQCYGKTTSQLLNAMRLEHAARELRMTSRPIIEIAFQSGYSNLGYFYRRFKEHFHRPPRRYRLEERSIVQ
ncbi:MAG: AraC family transcriptional regulator [Phycisphaerae bacterium]|nr:AraC family transcriptional regulator [Phycisphaerae bacterium]